PLASVTLTICTPPGRAMKAKFSAPRRSIRGGAAPTTRKRSVSSWRMIVRLPSRTMVRRPGSSITTRPPASRRSWRWLRSRSTLPVVASRCAPARLVAFGSAPVWRCGGAGAARGAWARAGLRPRHPVLLARRRLDALLLHAELLFRQAGSRRRALRGSLGRRRLRALLNVLLDVLLARQRLNTFLLYAGLLLLQDLRRDAGSGGLSGALGGRSLCSALGGRGLRTLLDVLLALQWALRLPELSLHARGRRRALTGLRRCSGRRCPRRGCSRRRCLHRLGLRLYH